MTNDYNRGRMVNLILDVIFNCTMTFTQKMHQFSEVGNRARRKFCKK